MTERKEPRELSIEELQELLYLKRRTRRQERLARLKAEGRVVQVDGLAAPELSGAPVVEESEETVPEEEGGAGEEPAGEAEGLARIAQRVPWHFLKDRLLLLIEVSAVIGLIVIAVLGWRAVQKLNDEIAEVQDAQTLSVALPTATATPVIGVVVLPGGHKPPVNGLPPEPGEAGYIPEHLLPIIDAYIPPPIPTPGPETARRLQIPAINIDKPIVQGDEWQQLKKGVGQFAGSTVPGQDGNLVLSAHNDIYGEIFRHLDQLEPGDEVIVSTEVRSYTYIINEIIIVEPTDVWVMAPTDHSQATLISCYPYLSNKKRIVVFADLATM